MDLSGTELKAKVAVAVENSELLRHTFNTIQSLIAQRDRGSGLAYCDAHTLNAAAVIVRRRWEEEQRKLGRLDLLATNKSLARQGFFPEDLPYPHEIRDKVLDEIKRCVWYKMAWGSGPK